MVSIPKGDAGSLNSFVSVVAISAINGKNGAVSGDKYDSQGGLLLGFSNHRKNIASFTFEMNKPQEVSKCQGTSSFSRDIVLPKDDTFFWQPPSINFIGNLPDE